MKELNSEGYINALCTYGYVIMLVTRNLDSLKENFNFQDLEREERNDGGINGGKTKSIKM